MIDGLVRKTRFTSFDGTLSLCTEHQRPDRFSHLESPDRTAFRIPRGGGYAYSAASFGGHSLVQEMTSFNRFLEFDPVQLTLKLEAGVRLIDLMEWALPRNLHFPVLPGYPLITVGGCVAADVHGKNPHKDGTFSDWVKQLTLYHPQHGYISCSPDEHPDLFSMTCGGYGLTGVITNVTLQLAELPAPAIALARKRVCSLSEANDCLSSQDSDIAYSWHDASPGASFGRGIVFNGSWSRTTQQPRPLTFRPMTADSRARLPFSAWNGLTARVANAAVLLQNRYQNDVSETGILAASFPFASNIYFHTLFGKPGLRETQFLVSEAKMGDCLVALEKLIRDTAAPTMMLSLKRFRGTQKSLSMSGTGCLVALDCYRNEKTDAFLRQLDQLLVDMGGQINLSKDSRISQEVAELAISSFAGFKERLFEYDKERIMRSELSHRLGLL
ncbi:MAG: FAD-binding oxidoreductase [Halioglobus sp.]|nr:FAD-binding oxidoreductase [Halioglobus sp.]